MTNRILFSVVCAIAIVTSGCALFRSKPVVEREGDPEWLENLKALKGTDATLGVSREARDIEKHLNAH